MDKEKEIAIKINNLKDKGSLTHSVIKKTCRIIEHIYYPGDETIKIKYCTGFGAGEEINNMIFPESKLDDMLKIFIVIPKEKSVLNIKPKNQLSMSDHTDNNLTGLRNHLFEAIRKLEGGTMRAEEAKAMASLAQTIINSAKLEMEFKLLVSKSPEIKMIN